MPMAADPGALGVLSKGDVRASPPSSPSSSPPSPARRRLAGLGPRRRLPRPAALALLFGRLALLAAPPGRLVRADEEAPGTLDAMLEQIESGRFANNFFAGGALRRPPHDAEEEVAGCLLDKVGAIVEEDGVAEFVNDLQVDLAACCTKGDRARCLADVRQPYALLADVKAGSRRPDGAGAEVAALLVRAVERRISADVASKAHAAYFGRCSEASDKCTLGDLKGQEL